METGTIKKWFERRGFGFIARGGAADAGLFVRVSELGGDVALLESKRGSFKIAHAARTGRHRAINVQFLN